MKFSRKVCFWSQHRTPIIPPASYPSPIAAAVGVTYLLYRNQVVKPDLHPLEHEMGFLLSREHARYSRHDAEHAQKFFQSHEQSLDYSGRQDAGQITDNFFGVEQYKDAEKAVVERYKPAPRITPNDFFYPFEEAVVSRPPVRHTLNRQLQDFLFLLVRSRKEDGWGLPSSTVRNPMETLRQTVDRAIVVQNSSLDFYLWSNSPQAVLPLEDGKEKVFAFCALYLAGRPQVESYEDHAWVTRGELYQYISGELLQVLLDITPDANFSTF